MMLCYQGTSVNFLRQKGVLITCNGSLFPYGKRTSKILSCYTSLFVCLIFRGSFPERKRGMFCERNLNEFALWFMGCEREWGKNTVHDGETLQLAAVSYKSPFLKINENRSLWIYKMADQWNVSPQDHGMIVLDILTGSSRTMSSVTDGSEINFRSRSLSLLSGSMCWQHLPPVGLDGRDRQLRRMLIFGPNRCFCW